jgi:hypothetical protein
VPVVRALLDAVFGFFVWAAHLLVVYIATAVACQLGLGAANTRTRTLFQGALALVTVAAVVVVALHAFRQFRRHHAARQAEFRARLTVGADAIAAVAIAWQLLAVLLVPLCA